MESEETKPESSNVKRENKKDHPYFIAKIDTISNSLKGPEVEEQRLKDKRAVIRSIKDPDLIVKGTEKEKCETEEENKDDSKEEQITGSNKGLIEKRSASFESLYKLPGTDIKLSSAQAESVGFIECMAGPRLPDFDETESETTWERMSNDDDSSHHEPILELFKSDEEEKTLEERDKKVKVHLPPEGSGLEDSQPKKRKFKRWKAKLKQKPLSPDPLMTEITQELDDYLNHLGVYTFMREWLCHLYGMNPKPKEPVKELKKFLDNALGNTGEESSLVELESELRTLLKREDIMHGEIRKLRHLAHLLAPEIYDPEGNMIVPEPSIEEDIEEQLEEEEMASEVTKERKEHKTTKAHKLRKTSKTKAVSRKTKGGKKAAGGDQLSRASKTSTRTGYKEKGGKRKRPMGKASKLKIK